MDEITGGNKWFKILGNFDDFKKSGSKSILSFGGPFSNHIAALAETGRRFGIPTIGIIRGESDFVSNKTLSRAIASGMKIQFVSRDDYRKFRNLSDYAELREQFGPVWVIPEGGACRQGVDGCMGIVDYFPKGVSTVALAVGTGATLSGISKRMNREQRLFGIQVLLAGQENFIGKYASMADEKGPDIQLIDRFTFGGYARKDEILTRFIADWVLQTQIPAEPVYTGKLFFGVIELIKEGLLPIDGSLLVIHTGGLQYLLD